MIGKLFIIALLLFPLSVSAETQVLTMQGTATDISVTEAFNLLTETGNIDKWYCLTGADVIQRIGSILVVHSGDETIAFNVYDSVSGFIDDTTEESSEEESSDSPYLENIDGFMKDYNFNTYVQDWDGGVLNDEKEREKALAMAKKQEAAGLFKDAAWSYNYAGKKVDWERMRQEVLSQYVTTEDWRYAAEIANSLGLKDEAKEYSIKTAERLKTKENYFGAAIYYSYAEDRDKVIEMLRLDNRLD